jgi:hypothetical protein
MRAYLRYLVLSLLGFMAITVAFTAFIDPYGWAGAPRVTGLNAMKPEAMRQVWPVKARQVVRAAPRTIVVGNSRVAYGFDPLSPAWPEHMRPVYNYGVEGGRLQDLAPHVRKAMELESVQAVFIGLDFYDFLQGDPRLEQFFNAQNGDAKPYLERVAQILFSNEAVRDSIRTIQRQGDAQPLSLTQQGYGLPGRFDRVWSDFGHYEQFRRIERGTFRQILNLDVSLPDPEDSNALHVLRRMIATAKANDVAVTLFTHPTHAEMFHGLQVAGYAADFVDWKRMILAEAAAQDIPFYDFAHVDADSIEPLPGPGDRETRMRGYWDAGHYKPVTGDRVVRAMTGPTPSRARIGPADLDAIAAANQAALAAYLDANPDSERRLREVMLSAGTIGDS